MGRFHAIIRMLRVRASRLRNEFRAYSRFPGLSLGRGVSLVVTDWSAIKMGEHIYIGDYSYVDVFRTTWFSAIEGSLSIDDETVIGGWANIRAAGGAIRIGKNVLIGQMVSILASNHKLNELGSAPRLSKWDESKTGVVIQDGAWIGAGCTVLPGVTIGSRSVLAAGAVASRSIPPNEIWGGIPARKIGTVPPRETF